MFGECCTLTKWHIKIIEFKNPNKTKNKKAGDFTDTQSTNKPTCIRIFFFLNFSIFIKKNYKLTKQVLEEVLKYLFLFFISQDRDL